MLSQGSNKDGSISEENLAYYLARSKVGGAVIVEACGINDEGWSFDRGIKLSRNNLERLKKLAKSIKKDRLLL